jgi:hypothetical protein
VFKLNLRISIPHLRFAVLVTGDPEDYCPLRWDAMQSARCSVTFRKNVLPKSALKIDATLFLHNVGKHLQDYTTLHS